MHGVFLSCRGYSVSSPRLQFRRACGGDSAQIVTPFVQVGTYPTRNFATLGPLLLRPPFTGASIQSFGRILTPPFNLPAPGRRQCLYVVSATLQTPVFLLNSRLGRFSAARFSSPRKVVHLTRAPLLPKLRGHFAEFLLHNSLEHLRLLASPTCVRLRYGRNVNFPAKLFLAA